jgi:hypothetical protein
MNSSLKLTTHKPLEYIEGRRKTEQVRRLKNATKRSIQD